MLCIIFKDPFRGLLTRCKFDEQVPGMITKAESSLAKQTVSFRIKLCLKHKQSKMMQVISRRSSNQNDYIIKSVTLLMA